MFARQKRTFSKETKYLIQGWIKSISKPTLDIPRIISFLICLYYELTDQWIMEQGEAIIDEEGMRISTTSRLLAFGAFKIYQNSSEKYEWIFDIQSIPKHSPSIRIGLQQCSINGGQFLLMNNGTRLRRYSSGASSIWCRYTDKWGDGDKLKMLYHHNCISFAINNKCYKQTFQLQHEHFSEGSYYQLFASLSEKCIIKIRKFNVYR